MKQIFTAEILFILLGVVLTLLFGKVWVWSIPVLYLVATCPKVNEFMAKHVGTRPTKTPRG